MSPEEVIRISHLARLAIDEKGVAEFTAKLTTIFELVAQMNQVDTHNIAPTTHPLDIQQRLRPDVVTESNQRELMQKIAPQTEAGLYLVPQVIE